MISRHFPDINEASFKALSVEEPAVTSALLKAAQQGDQSAWLAFQRDAHRAKLQRDRVSAERIAAEAELAVARRGGGAVAAAAAAAKAKAEALRSSLGDDGSGLSTSDARRIVLISGFESFNVGLYRKAARNLARPKLSTLWAAGVAFSKCHAEREVPYDPYTPHVFDGEEFSRGARLWTAGYDFYTPR